MLFIYCFLYRSSTRFFRVTFLSFILLFQLSQYLSLLSFQFTQSRVLLASFVTFIASLNIVIVLFNLWLPASEIKFLNIEEQFLQSRCDRKLIRMLVASLGTIEVTDEPNDQEEDIVIVNKVTKPILVLLHGYGGCNAQWAECLSMLQRRSHTIYLVGSPHYSPLQGFKYIVSSSMDSGEVHVSDGVKDGKGILWKNHWML